MKHNGVPSHLDRPSEANVTGFLMQLVVGALSILFIASIIGYLWIRYSAQPLPIAGADPLPAPGMPQLPLGGLILSTVLLIVSSFTLHFALLSARRGQQQALKAGMVITLLLGLGFLASQIHNWVELSRMGLLFSNTTYKISFILTLLHAIHVVGGVIPLAVVTAAAFRGAYTPASHLGIRMFAMYWHFLDVVWLALLTLLIATA